MTTVTTKSRFTGGDNLTGIEKTIHNVMMQNELGEGYGAYKISHAQKAGSGYSFGPVQWDVLRDHKIDEELGGDLTARTLFEDIITNATENGIMNKNERQSIWDVVTTEGEYLTKNQQDLINKAICSEDGVSRIHEAYLLELECKIIKIDKVINEIADPSLSKPFLQGDLGKVFLADFYNQFGEKTQLIFEDYISGKEVKMYDGTTRIAMQLEGELTVKSILDFYLHTQYAQVPDKNGNTGMSDLIRRFSNVAEANGIIKTAGMLTPEDKAYLQDLKSQNATAFADVRQLGLRTLTVIDEINTVIDGVSGLLDQAYLRNSDMAAYIIGDIKYRYGDKITDAMLQGYFNGEQITLPNGKKIQLNGDLGFEDLCRLYLNVPGDKSNRMQRLSDMIEAVGIENIRLTAEDVEFLQNELPNLVGANLYKKILDLLGNWGLRDLMLKAREENWVSWSINELFNKANNVFNAARSLFRKAGGTKSPLILDLDRDGEVETTTLNAGVYFDYDKNGFAEQSGWVSSDDGILVMDRNSDNVINDGTEMFGDETILQNGQRAANGFQALAELDDNKDGKIDASDSAFSSLKIWQDFNGDGYSSPDELWGLSDLEIQSINTGYTTSTIVDELGNEHRQVGSFTWSDETVGKATDVWFQTDKMFTVADEYLDVPDEIAVLPDLEGFGNVYDLQQAMVRDESGHLKNLVEQFAAETDANVLHTLNSCQMKGVGCWL